MDYSFEPLSQRKRRSAENFRRISIYAAECLLEPMVKIGSHQANNAGRSEQVEEIEVEFRWLRPAVGQDFFDELVGVYTLSNRLCGMGQFQKMLRLI